MKRAALVTEATLTSAKLAKVLCRLWYYIVIQVKLDAANGDYMPDSG